jgi:hypothetical protein
MTPTDRRARIFIAGKFVSAGRAALARPATTASENQKNAQISCKMKKGPAAARPL